MVIQPKNDSVVELSRPNNIRFKARPYINCFRHALLRPHMFFCFLFY